MEFTENQCTQVANVIGGKGQLEGGVCSVTKSRPGINAAIANMPFHSLSHSFHFEAPDDDGYSLITGELVLLESEVSKVQAMLPGMGIIIGAIHNHWIYDSPKLIYLHMEAVMNPVDFAKSISDVLHSLL